MPLPRMIGAAVWALVVGSSALAQSSASFTLEEYAFNAGGAPAQGQSPASTNFGLTLASVGDAIVASGLSSVSFEMDAGFSAAYPPPAEVAPECAASEHCLVFTDAVTLQWPPHRSAGVYNLYRGSTGNGFGSCEQSMLGGTTTTDGEEPTPAGAFYYLVTVENRLGEEGTKGFRSDSTERGGAVCP